METRSASGLAGRATPNDHAGRTDHAGPADPATPAEWTGRADRAAAKLLRVAVASVGRLPRGPAYALADALAPLVALALRRRERRVGPLGRGVRRNLRIAFRHDLDAASERRHERAYARHLARLAVEFCRLPHAGDALDAELAPEDLECLRRLRDRGRGLLLVTGHIGVWEGCPRVASALGEPLAIVVRPLPGPALEAAVRDVRRCAGQRLIDQRGALWPVVRALRRGELVGVLADEDVSERPIFAPFLGTPAATTPAPAFLQRLTGAPIAVVACHRVARGRLRLRVWDVIESQPTGDREKDLERVTRRMNAALSRAIRAEPAQWLWGSRRFATRPPGERPGPDGLPPPAPEPQEDRP